MKTKVILSAITLVLAIVANSLFAGRNNDPAPVSGKKIITYVVKINFAANFCNSNGHYVVAITDGNGNRVVPAQNFQPGVSTYSFRESGSFSGTRTAVMVPVPVSPSGWIPTGWVIPPCVLKGNFAGGATYNFELTPEQIEKSGLNDL
jgi:hypothetical protein